MLRRALPGLWTRSSLRFAAGAHAETSKAFSLMDGPVCRDPRILRKTAVFFCTSASVFASAAWITNSHESYWWAKALECCSDDSGLRCGPVTGNVDEDGPLRIRHLASLATIRKWREVLLSPLPETLRKCVVVQLPFEEAWHFVRQYDAMKVVKTVTLVNIAVFCAWRFPPLWTFLGKHTLHHGLSGRSYTMFTAGFCHVHLFHLVSNSLGLVLLAGGLGHIEMQDGARPQWTYSVPHLAAFWIVACAFGLYFPNVISLIAFRNRIRALPPTTNLMAHSLDPWHPVPLLMHSGASTGLYSLATVLALSPAGDGSPFTAIFGYSFTWRQAAWAYASVEATTHLVAYTSAPIHLSGALFGAVYFYYGPTFWEWIRNAVGNRRTAYMFDEKEESVKAFVRI